MRYVVHLTNPALEMIADHQEDIAIRSEERAQSWTSELLKHLREHIAEHPRMAPAHAEAKDEAIRRLSWRNYIVIYKVIDTAGLIFVLSVRHARQAPLGPEHF